MADMDPKALERLRRLQMADLGTARREYISTHERGRSAEIGLDKLDATRVANQAGSEAHRAAELNKARLAGWANVHKDLSDTQDLENLDNLLDGQSHRAQLTALIRESGGQSYTKVLNKKDNFLKVAEADHRAGPSSGRNWSGGRGGGVIGTRGRKTPSKSPESGSSRTSNHGVIKKLGRYTVEAPPGRTRLDPALDVKNEPSKSDRLDKPQNQGSDKYRQMLRTSIRTRRPITGDYSRILSPPESFLAIARSVVQDKPSNDTSAATQQSPNIPSSPNVRAEQDQDETRNPAENISVPSQDNAQKKASASLPRSESASESIPDLVASLHGASSERQPVPPFEEPSTPKPQVNPASVEPQEELLLDFGTTPPEPSPFREKTIQSPAIEDLKGIDFEHSTNAKSSASGLHEQSNSEKQTKSMNESSSTAAIATSKKISRSDYEREIFLLGVFLESTTLGEEYCDQFKKIKAELEEHLRRDHPQETTAEAAQKVSEYDKTSSTNTASSTPAVDPKSTAAALSTAENTPIKQAENSSMPTTEESASSQRLRHAINAPPFHPRAGSFSGYRSPINSTSSDSTPPATPVPSRSKAIPIKKPSQVPESPAPEPEPSTEHIFGDHLLPGRRSRTVSTLQSTNEDTSRKTSASAHSPSVRPANTLHTAASSIESKAPEATPIVQKTEPVKCEPQSSVPKLTSIQQSMHSMSPSSKTNASENTPVSHTVASTTHANPTTSTQTPESAKSSSASLVRELPGPKPKLGSIEQSIHAVSGWTPSKNQPSMSMPRFSQRPDPNVHRPERSNVYSTPPNLQKKDESTRFSGLTSSRYATPEK